MNNIENCLQNKIATSNNKLQPTIFRAILNLFKKGFSQITARMVKEECIKIDQNTDWNQRLNAICNSMERTIECGVRIISENKPHNDFTISFDDNGNNLEFSTPKKTPPQAEINKKDATPKDSHQNSSIDEKIDDKLRLLDWEELKNNQTPKLLIIGCCDAKSHQPINLTNSGKSNFSFGNNIDILRKLRFEYYKKLPNSYFTNAKKKRNKEIVDKSYFMNCLNENNRRKALEVYGSNGSPFYKPDMKELYETKIKNSNLHLLIVSGLYGIIKHDDYINDYHLKIKKGKEGFWGDKLSMAIQDYIKINEIDNNNVIYSLSNEYKLNLNPKLSQWKDIWIVCAKDSKTENLINSAKCVSRFLNELP